MKPITLVLSSYEPNEWRLNIASGAVVEKILLSGFHPQTITGAGNIPVETGFQLTPHRWPNSTGGGSTQEDIVDFEAHLGTPISSFSGVYRATSFTVTGSPANVPNNHPRLGAGNLTDGPEPDLIYDRDTGRVQVDLSDLAAQHSDFKSRNLHIALVNHDSSFTPNHLGPYTISGLNASHIAFNSNRIGYDYVRLNNWNGQLLDFGNILPAGITDKAVLRDYLATAHFELANRSAGDLDLVVVPEPESIYMMLFAVLALILFVAYRLKRKPVS